MSDSTPVEPEQANTEADDAEWDRRDFISLLDFVRSGMVSEEQALMDLPPNMDKELLKRLIARDRRYDRTDTTEDE